jgi:hypothetical protein
MEQLAKQLSELSVKDIAQLKGLLYELYDLTFELGVDGWKVREKINRAERVLNEA